MKAVLLRDLPRFWFNIPRFGFALAPQVNRVATDIEHLTCLTFLETVQFDRLHDFLPKILALWVEPLKWGRCNGNPYSLRPNLDGYSYRLSTTK